MTTLINRYRIESGTVYEFDSNADTYICIGVTTQYGGSELCRMRAEKVNENTHTINWPDEDEDN